MSFPGLPSLSAVASSLFSAAVGLLTSDILGGIIQQTQWGIFLNGQQVVQPDTIISFEYSQDFNLSDYPIEQGSFASYNKVQRPFMVRLRLSKGGAVADRANFLTSIQQIIGDVNLYDIVTPEVIYSNLNLVRQSYVRRSDSGAGMITVDIIAEEVRPASLATSQSTVTQATTGSTSTTTPSASQGTITIRPIGDGVGSAPQNAAATPQANGGGVQPQAPTTAENASFMSALAGSGPPF